MSEYKIIGLDGLDKAGKSTIARNLAATLRKSGKVVEVISNTSSTKYSSGVLRKIINGDIKTKTQHLESQLFSLGYDFLFEHMSKLAMDNIFEDVIFIMDRTHVSAIAYQGEASGETNESVEQLYYYKQKPVITFYIDIPVSTMRERMMYNKEEGTDIFESRGDSYYKTVKKTFDNYEGLIKIDGTLPLYKQESQILDALRRRRIV